MKPELQHLLLALLTSTLPALAIPDAHAAAACKGTLYLTFDTGNMRHAESIADTLARHGVKATFFLAQEETSRGDHALDASWAPYWQARVAEGHAFGSHTWRHGSFRATAANRCATGCRMAAPRSSTRAPSARSCSDPIVRFQELTGRRLDPSLACSGRPHHTEHAIRGARACGYQHVGWAPAGFLGDELPSDTYPNPVLLQRALDRLKNGDIVMAHLGIWSRKDPFAPMLDPLIFGLKNKGFCFATRRAP
jgi:peptidoglycan/xylan/chitin deacetylase (PgdA/CDA1 family)